MLAVHVSNPFFFFSRLRKLVSIPSSLIFLRVTRHKILSEVLFHGWRCLSDLPAVVVVVVGNHTE